MGSLMPSVYDCMVKLAEVQGSLEVETPYQSRVKRAWAFMPPANVADSDLPVWFNQLGMEPQLRANLDWLKFTIHMQLLIGQAGVEADKKQELAASFLEAIIRKLNLDVTLGFGGGVHLRNLRAAGDEVITRIERNNIGYVGLDLMADLDIIRAGEFGP